MTDDIQEPGEQDALAQELERAIEDIDTVMEKLYADVAGKLKAIEKDLARSDKQVAAVFEDAGKALDALDAASG